MASAERLLGGVDEARYPSQDHGLQSLAAAKKMAGLGCCRQP